MPALNLPGCLRLIAANVEVFNFRGAMTRPSRATKKQKVVRDGERFGYADPVHIAFLALVYEASPYSPKLWLP